MSRQSPIGIFDSGIGGLTVAHAIKQALPQESLVYFGDTAHLPYGDKSEAAIQAYSVRIANVLIERGCKVIVIACNSASSAAYELLKEYVRHQAHVIDVIDPMVRHVSSQFGGRKVGLIGTKRTIQSGIYTAKMERADPSIQLLPLATPLLVPMIEEGYFNNQISHDVISQYLGDPLFGAIDALILGCTHYPLIRDEINEFFRGRVQILDSTAVVAATLKTYLESAQLLSDAMPTYEFLVSDYTESFEASTRVFFHEPARLQRYPLW
ncbi:MAG: glutamate racemase [Cyclobacteriaceae bacterium]|nr:glutamate racemase [Cyclobacteriaceae bacterium]